jgi:uncharacterized membrane protein
MGAYVQVMVVAIGVGVLVERSRLPVVVHPVTAPICTLWVVWGDWPSLPSGFGSLCRAAGLTDQRRRWIVTA